MPSLVSLTAASVWALQPFSSAAPAFVLNDYTGYVTAPMNETNTMPNKSLLYGYCNLGELYCFNEIANDLGKLTTRSAPLSSLLSAPLLTLCFLLTPAKAILSINSCIRTVELTLTGRAATPATLQAASAITPVHMKHLNVQMVAIGTKGGMYV
jgi:hypothetical protein